MITDPQICVSHAKYYKCSHSGGLSDLPRSTDINKQITYAEYIATNSKFEEHKSGKCVLNVFLMPFSKTNNIFGTNDKYLSIGESVAEWKHFATDYEHVKGILTAIHVYTNNETKCIEY